MGTINHSHSRNNSSFQTESKHVMHPTQLVWKVKITWVVLWLQLFSSCKIHYNINQFQLCTTKTLQMHSNFDVGWNISHLGGSQRNVCLTMGKLTKVASQYLDNTSYLKWTWNGKRKLWRVRIAFSSMDSVARYCEGYFRPRWQHCQSQCSRSLIGWNLITWLNTGLWLVDVSHLYWVTRRSAIQWRLSWRWWQLLSGL